MLKPSDAAAQFKKMLQEADFNIQKPDPHIAWNVFQSFAQKSADCAGDGILFQCGMFGFGDSGEKFYLDFARQFEFENEDGEYDHMEQLHCEFTCAPSIELADVQKNLWSFNFDSLPEYFAAVEKLPEFQVAISQKGWLCKVEQEGV